MRKEKSRFELWLNRMNQIKLQFRQFVDSLNETLETYSVTYYEYPTITFDIFQELEERGSSQNTFFFSIRFYHRETKKIVQTFVFRFFRDRYKFPTNSSIIPLELNCFNPETKNFLVIDRFTWTDKVQLRSFYFDQSNEIVTAQYNRAQRKTINENNLKLHEVVETFFSDVLGNVLGI
ncbi:MAG: hypothetical protein EAZ97_02930 [Bacteroidetes bacterium]|nr:MAG: hypothetical protein EAZ97_02930 [Bacteroidota bacterium]